MAEPLESRYKEFLALLGQDRKSAEASYLKLYQKLESYFRWNNCLDFTNCAGETISQAIRSWPKEPVKNVQAFVFTVARNIKYEMLRRARKMPLEDIVEKNLAAHHASDNEGEAVYDCMSFCLKQLDNEKRSLIVRFHSLPLDVPKAVYRARIAEELGITVNALRIRISHIKSGLRLCQQDCLRSKNEFCT